MFEVRKNSTNTGRSLAAVALLLLLTLVMSSCAAVDQYGSRAVQYNQETGDSKSSAVLLNIMRSAYSVPLQFTDVSTATGTATASATIGSSIPLGGPRGTGSELTTISPGATWTGNGTFNVANLNTQEFYNGLQTPLSTQLIASYLDAGFSPYVLLTLAISDIEVNVNGVRSSLRNNAADPAAFAAFYTAIKFLVEWGLTVEKVSDTKDLIPTSVNLTAKQASDPKVMAALITGSATATSGSDVPKIALDSDTGHFKLVKDGSKYRFCFDPLKRLREERRFPYPGVDFVSVRDRQLKQIKEIQVPLAMAYAKPLPGLTLTIKEAHFCGNKSSAKDTDTFKMRTRSVEGIFNFLGEMVRTEMGLGTGHAESLAIPLDAEGNTFKLFRVQAGLFHPRGISIFYDGELYGIAVDPTAAHDTSSRVIQLLTELLALQSSAKNLPAPNVISILSP